MSSAAPPIRTDASLTAVTDSVTHVHARARFGITDVGLIVGALIWGVNFSIVKVGLNAFEPLTFAALRVALAALVLCALVATLQPAALPSRKDIIALAVLGLVGNGMYQLLFLAGISRTRAGIAALLIAAGPAWIAIISRMFRREQLPSRGWIGIGLQVIGVGWVVGSAHGVDTGGEAMYGAVLIGIGAITWAVYTVVLQPYTSTVNPLHLAAITTASGALVCVAAAVPSLVRTNWNAIGLDAWGAVLYASLGAMVIAYMLYYRGVRVLGATRTAVYGNLQPLIALAVAAIMLGETPTGPQLLGAAFIMGGLLMSRMARVTTVVERPSIPESA